jgi:T-complex protein 1 subunit zeta
MTSALHSINPDADIIDRAHARQMNSTAAKGLADILKSNLGPKGTMKMLVSGAGDVQLTKDGKVLLDQMQIQHPTACIIARTATAQDDITGDGTTSNVLFTGELFKQAERWLDEGLHPRVMVEGYELAKERTMKFLDSYKCEFPESKIDRDLMVQVARTSLRTKLHLELADHLVQIVVDAVCAVHQPGKPLDLHMVEIMHMRHKSEMDTRFVNGLVLDHGARHPDMAKRSENCFILTCNLSLEYEKSMVQAGFHYNSAEQRTKMVAAERKYTDDKVRQVIALKESVCKNGEGFIVINQKGIDPISLDMLQQAGIVGIRRAKRRNMERLVRACGGIAINSLDDATPECLGHADLVFEHTLGDDKFTFVEGCKNATSCTVLIRAPNDHTIRQIKDAIRDGLRSVKNLLDDQCLIPGAGAFECAAHLHLMEYKKEVKGRAKLGVQAFADALLCIPKVLAENSGLDVQGSIINVLDEQAEGTVCGLDVDTGKPLLPKEVGLWDNYCVKKQFLHLGSLMAIKLLLVDECMRAGRKMGKQ